MNHNYKLTDFRRMQGEANTDRRLLKGFYTAKNYKEEE